MKLPTVPLEEVCDFLSGNAWSASDFTEGPEGLPIIRIQNVDSVRDSEFVYWSRDFESRFLVQGGDVLLTLSGSFRVAIWDGPPALLNQRIVKLIPKSNVHRDWLLYSVRDRLLQISGLGRHALVSNVALSDLRKLSIPLPPLPEQRRIAAILHQTDALRAKRREALAELESLKLSIFMDLFGSPTSNPKGWPQMALTEICSPKQWPTITTGQLKDYGFPVFGANGLIGYFDQYNHEEETVLITCRGATCGTINLSPPKCYVTGNSMALDNPDLSLVTKDYLGDALRIRGLADVISGTAQPQITRQGLASVKLPLPPLELQQRFSTLVRHVQEVRAKQVESMEELDTLFASLQHRAFAGQLS